MRNPTVCKRVGHTGETASLANASAKLREPITGARQQQTLRGAALAAAWLVPLFLMTSPSSPAGTGRPPEDPSAPARVTYTRTLAGSVPEYLAVVVNSDGSGTYVGRSLTETRQPRPLQLSQATTRQIFALASNLDDFRVPLESRKKVADLGLKTFTYEQGSVKNAVEFNYTTKPTARDLTDLFERIAGVEEHLDSLRYALKYDPLSLPQELLHIQIDLEHNALADPELMVPELEEIAKNPRLLHVAQVRAQDILKTVDHGQ
jgi:hypothetical protein